ncbi:MAG: T9SS type A sorting domain-containing protein [candidate division Zixibacteria bacterium]|nr:T9SS type A sorting domain-containing protein [candidate division Zixibacteria bacterium]
MTQEGPVCDAVAPQSVHWLDHLTVQLPATDDGCPDPLTWTLDSDGGLGGTLSVAGGSLEYDPVCADVGGTYLVEYTVSDGAKDCQGSVEVTVTNDAPTIVCPDPADDGFLCDGNVINDNDGLFNLGELIEGQADGDDLNGDPLTYSLISAAGPGALGNAPTVNPNTGEFSWQSEATDAEGDYTFCIEVTDGCQTDTCCFTITMDLNFYVKILDSTGTVDTIPTFPGEVTCAYVNIFPDLPLGGLDLLLCYDRTALTFLGGVEPLGDFDAWEYVTYRHGVNSNCVDPCPSGLIRIVAIADMDNGPDNHPEEDEFGLEGNVMKICFQVTSDWNFLGQCLPIDFCSYDCGDNTLSSKDGTTLYVEHGSLVDCPDPKPGKDALEEIDFCGGAICIREPQDARGDLNLNSIANEVADAVLYSRYFIEGIDVFSSVEQTRLVQIQASDVNNDGVTLTVADLIYLIRIITGDAQPFPDDAGQPKIAPYANSADVVTDTRNGRLSITTDAAVELGGAVLTFRYSDVAFDKAQTTEASEGMAVTSKASRGEFHVLMAPEYQNLSAIQTGRNEILSVPYEGNGTIELVDVQLADAEGRLLSTNHQSMAKLVPQSYALLQNYPNPFNAGTVIRFDLKDASDWNLTIYNITGQVVRTFSGHNEASRVNVQWDGRDINGNETASGVYLYKINAGDYTSSKKMTLIK